MCIYLTASKNNNMQTNKQKQNNNNKTHKQTKKSLSLANKIRDNYSILQTIK